MKKIIVFVVAVTVVMLLVLVATTFAHEGDSHDCHWDSGRAFGQHHAQMAQNGMLGGHHNPGTHHQGYSICVP
jgi:hypothetical protein